MVAMGNDGFADVGGGPFSISYPPTNAVVPMVMINVSAFRIDYPAPQYNQQSGNPFPRFSAQSVPACGLLDQPSLSHILSLSGPSPLLPFRFLGYPFYMLRPLLLTWDLKFSSSLSEWKGPACKLQHS